MNVILFNKGLLPSYITITLNQIRKYNSDIDIYLISDNVFNSESCKYINLKDLKSEYISFFSQSDFYVNDLNPLWRTSIERFFYIHGLIEELNLTNIFHFDNDVLVYDNFENVVKKITDETNLITPANENNLVCGMLYTKNKLSFLEIIHRLYLKIKLGQTKLQSMYKNKSIIYNNKEVEKFHLSEMSLLKIIQDEYKCIFDFPIMPHDSNYDKFNMCFDPSSWGQYICTYDNHPPKYYSSHHYIGRYIENKTYDLIFENKMPYITYKDTTYKLFNLHVHSKKLEKWI